MCCFLCTLRSRLFLNSSAPTFLLRFGHKGRLDDLNADYQAREQDRLKKGRMPPPKVQRLGFSIDDIVGADEASCSRFKNDKFIEEKLVWPSSLQTKVKRFLTLSR
jgi:hypothetical protein